MVGSSLFLMSVPVLLLGIGLAAGMRSNHTRGLASLLTQGIATLLVLVSIWPILSGSPAIEVIWPWPAPIERIAFRIDALSAFFLAWSLPMTLLGTLYAVGYLQPVLHRGTQRRAAFRAAQHDVALVRVVYSAQNALVFLLGWEIAAVAAWLMVIWDYRNQKIRFAGFNYLVSTHIGLFVLVAAFMLIYS